MTLVVIKGVRELLRGNITRDRMNAVLTAFGQLGDPAFEVQRDAGLKGVLAFCETSNGNDMIPDLNYWQTIQRTDPFPARGAPNWIPANDYANPTLGGMDDGSKPYLRFPWGETPPAALRNPNDTTPERPDAFLLRHFSVDRTRELLKLAGIIVPTLDSTKPYKDYMTDRSPKKDWNDAWGNPLVVAFAMYQPPRNNPIDNRNPATASNGEDYIFKVAREKYKSIRNVYLSVAAAGPSLPELNQATLTSDNESKWIGPTGVPAVIWKRVAVGDPKSQVQPVCQQGTWDAQLKRWSGEWSESSWTTPPWSDIKKGELTDKDVKYKCFLSHPIVLKSQ
jgi:hypothetical protein